MTDVCFSRAASQNVARMMMGQGLRGRPTERLPSVIGLTGGNLGTNGRLARRWWLRCRLHNAGGG